MIQIVVYEVHADPPQFRLSILLNLDWEVFRQALGRIG